MAAVAVDAGTSMIKAVLFGDDGAEIVVSRRATEVLRPRPGWAEQDMAAVWEAVVAAVREVLTHARDDVRFVALTAQGDGCWLVDEDGEPTGPAILWSDGRAAEVVEGWRRAGTAEKAFQLNGSLGFSGLPHAILTWLHEHDHARLSKSATALYCGGWLFSRCTGVRGADFSDASVPFLDPRARAYSPELLALFGLDWAARLLPEIIDHTARSAPLTGEAASRLGLAEGTPVVLAPYDVVSMAVGMGVTEPGQACTILGTTLCTEVVHDTVDTSGEPSGLTIVLDHGTDVLRAFPTLAGTEVLDWTTRMLGLDHPRELGALAAGSPPGAHGLIFLPYLSPAGERAPFLDPYARGTFWGLSLEHDRADLARAVFEGLSLVIRDCVAASSARVRDLRLCGGGAVSDLWCQLIADVVGVPTARSADTEVGARGAFLSGLVATGAEPDLAAASHHVRLASYWQPDPDRARHYTGLYGRFLELREIAAQGWRAGETTGPGA
ncbi:carbohydrate kinase [Prauserella sp. PE36]|uniref:FGGY-family carbohydrate kinase n=1 Tax=Prauserella sp. PE36 TaxID=1504709 RepID=UPI000DE3B764|nr:FGGY-family carbohydrate kinase [Prauserella sp. PE36]RBM21690.1 carbohydrate kinase [Prauserella sp. PE36]